MPAEKIFQISIMDVNITEFMKDGFDTSVDGHKQWTAWCRKFPKSEELFNNLNEKIAAAAKENPDQIPFSVNGRKGYGTIGFDDDADGCIYQIAIK